VAQSPTSLPKNVKTAAVPKSAFRFSTQPDSTEVLRTPFDPPAKAPSSIVQAAGWGGFRSKKVSNAAGKISRDPFLDLETSTGEAPAAISDPAPEIAPIKPQPKSRKILTREPREEEENPDSILSVNPPPIPSANRSRRTATVSKVDDGDEVPSRATDVEVPSRPRTAANRPLQTAKPDQDRSAKTPARRGLIQNGKVVRQPQSPAPAASLEWRTSDSQATKKPRAAEFNPVNQEVENLPNLAEAAAETPLVDMLPAPPENDSLVGRYRTPLRQSRDDGDAWDVAAPPPRDARLPDSFAAATGSVPPPPVVDNPVREHASTKSRGTVVKTAKSTTRRKNKSAIAKTPSTLKYQGPIIRPAQRENEPQTAQVAGPRFDTTALTQTTTGNSDRSSESSGGGQTSSRASIPQVPFAPQGWNTPVTLQGIIAEEDEGPPSRSRVAERTLSLPHDIGDSIPSNVPPPPMGVTAAPGMTFPQIGQGESDSAPTLPLLPTTTIEPAPAPLLAQAKSLRAKAGVTSPAEGEPRFDEEIDSLVETPSASSISQTSLIGLCVGLTGLLGLLIWRFLERRTHRQRRNRQAAEKSAVATIALAEGSAATTVDEAPASIEMRRAA
jgi:hypothetical protein